MQEIIAGYSHPLGSIIREPGSLGVLVAHGTTVPAAASVGFAPGCIFFDIDAAAGAQLWVNEGTAASSTFVPLNDTRKRAETVITTNVITADESGKTFFLALAGGFTSTLPAPAAGLNFRFIVAIAPTTAYIIVTNASANIMYGMMEERAGTAGVAGAARDTFNFVANQAIIGDWVDFESDGTNWYYHGMVDVAAGNTVAAT